MSDVLDVVGAVSDRLVGGMMFHSDHADMMRLLGIKSLRRLHEDGFSNDSHNMRKVRKACVSYLGKIPPHGKQERTKTLDSVAKRGADGIGASERQRLVRASMSDWIEWESGTIDTYARAANELCDHAVMWELMRELQSDTERELSHAREVSLELESCGYDMCHIFEMG